MTEAQLHEQVCRYLAMKWPLLIFWSDGSGNNLSPIQAAKAAGLRSGRGVPDLFIARPKGIYAGCFLELKTEKNTPYIKGDTLSTGVHVQEQAEMLQALVREGYFANFAVGLTDTLRLVDWYMAL